jgi:hypothetical protein
VHTRSYDADYDRAVCECDANYFGANCDVSDTINIHIHIIILRRLLLLIILIYFIIIIIIIFLTQISRAVGEDSECSGSDHC